jgi:hypothetical protein
MVESVHYGRIGKKLGLLILGMILFLLITMWLKGMEFRFRVFMALFAGFSAWMGIVSLVIWLWKDMRLEEEERSKGEEAPPPSPESSAGKD